MVGFIAHQELNTLKKCDMSLQFQDRIRFRIDVEIPGTAHESVMLRHYFVKTRTKCASKVS